MWRGYGLLVVASALTRSEQRRAEAAQAVASKASRFTDRVESTKERAERLRQEAMRTALERQMAKDTGMPFAWGGVLLFDTCPPSAAHDGCVTFTVWCATALMETGHRRAKSINQSKSKAAEHVQKVENVRRRRSSVITMEEEKAAQREKSIEACTCSAPIAFTLQRRM